MANLCDKEGDTSAHSDLNRGELLNLLARLQGEIDARDIVISTLQCELANSICSNAKCHRYFLNEGFFIEPSDVIYALQRDEKLCGSSTHSLDINKQPKFNSAGKTKFELCELIEAQKRIHSFYKERLQSAEDKYNQLCSCIAAERHAHNCEKLASSEAVAKLEAENNSLRSELETVKMQNEKLENDLKISLHHYAELKLLTQKQRVVAAKLIKERRTFSRYLDSLRQSSDFSEKSPRLVSSALSNETASKSIGLNGISHDAAPLIRPNTQTEGGNFPEILESLSFQVDITSDPSKVISSFADYEFQVKPINAIFSTPSTEHLQSPESLTATSNYVSVSCDSNIVSDESPASFISTKLRPEPPVRRTPEYTSPTTDIIRSSPLSVSQISKYAFETPDSCNLTKLIPSSHLDKVNQSEPLVESEVYRSDKNRASTPSPPPPPPPPMQLHYPYPGMHGNTCHPPLACLSPLSRNTSSTVTSPHHFPVSPPRVHSSRSPPAQQIFNNLNKMSPSIQKSRDNYSNTAQKSAPYVRPTMPNATKIATMLQSRLVSVDLNYPGDGSLTSDDLSQLLSSGFIHSPSPPVPTVVRTPVSTVNYHLKDGHASSPTGIIYSPRVIVTSRNSSTGPGGNFYVNGK